MPTRFRDSEVTMISLSSCLLNTCLRHHLKALTAFFFLVILVNATPHFLDRDLQSSDSELINTLEKRPARLSYFRSPSRSTWRSRGGRKSYYSGNAWRRYEPRGGGRYRNHRLRPAGFGSYGENEWWRKKAVNRNRMPWDRLPEGNCLRQSCSRDTDCCRRFSKCSKRAHVCYDCWYGHPCRHDHDCCLNFPYCNRSLKTCGK